MFPTTGLLTVLVFLAGTCAAVAPQPPLGQAEAVGALLDRVLPGARQHFSLGLDGPRGQYTLADGPDGMVTITAGTASDLAAGVGAYLMDHCDMTFGWPRGGGQNVFLPPSWPTIGAAPVTRRRSAPYGNINVVLTPFSRIPQPYTTHHALCAVLYLVAMPADR